MNIYRDWWANWSQYNENVRFINNMVTDNDIKQFIKKNISENERKYFELLLNIAYSNEDKIIFSELIIGKTNRYNSL